MDDIIIESDSLKLEGILDKRYSRAQLPDGKLVDLISTIGFGAEASNTCDQYPDLRAHFIPASAFHHPDSSLSAVSGEAEETASWGDTVLRRAQVGQVDPPRAG